jgi:peroxiredoxin
MQSGFGGNSLSKNKDSELKVGDKAPEFRAVAVGGKYGAGREVALADFRGRSLVLYFYPKDDTPGCTTQACGLRDSWSQFDGSAEIFGVSVESGGESRKVHCQISASFSASLRSRTQNG